MMFIELKERFTEKLISFNVKQIIKIYPSVGLDGGSCIYTADGEATFVKESYEQIRDTVMNQYP